MHRAAVVYNPLKVTDLEALTDRVEKLLAQEGWQPPQWFATREEDPGVGMCRQALQGGCDLVLVVGGDGTVMAAATALASSDVPMAVVPLGTGNLLARNLGIPLDEGEALRIGMSGATRAIDVGAVGDRRFVVMAGLGFDAAMMRDAPEGLKRRMGWPAYVLAGSRHLRERPIAITLTIDDAPPRSRHVRSVVVGNVGRLEADIPLLPDAQPDDGVLDVVVIAPRSVLDWPRVVARVLRRADRADGLLERFTGRRVRIECRNTQPRQLDGEPIDSGTELAISVEPGALKVRVPHNEVESPCRP
jgi:YegS/Rv2252/BmrU family lipid kinase